MPRPRGAGTTGTPPAPADIQTAAIPAANVVARAESDTNTLNIIRNRMQGAIQYTSIRQQLLRLGQDATDTRALSHLARLGQPSVACAT